MALKIKANTLTENRYLEVGAEGVICYQSAFFGGKRRYRFQEIDGVFLSASQVLSLQVGQEVFSLPVNLEKAKHKETLDALLWALRNPP